MRPCTYRDLALLMLRFMLYIVPVFLMNGYAPPVIAYLYILSIMPMVTMDTLGLIRPPFNIVTAVTASIIGSLIAAEYGVAGPAASIMSTPATTPEIRLWYTAPVIAVLAVYAAASVLAHRFYRTSKRAQSGAG